ncbi:MAG TPA: hypothetical protein VGT41_06455 [Candidatus Babeliales bacterium]|nr:hypothetical protein [Candidatus Babeliales bacterium]
MNNPLIDAFVRLQNLTPANALEQLFNLFHRIARANTEEIIAIFQAFDLFQEMTDSSANEDFEEHLNKIELAIMHRMVAIVAQTPIERREGIRKTLFYAASDSGYCIMLGKSKF